MREKIIDCFNEYIRGFDNSDPMIILKKEHTYRVANLSEIIARSISDIYDLSEGDVDLAWIIGMFHDIGRFEQVKRYGTFRDADSIDHAQFGADILFDSNRDARLRLVLPESEIIEIAIRNHNKYRLPMDLSKRESIFCNIIRDADKLDILRILLDCTTEEIYGVSDEELLVSEITDEVLENALEGHAVDRALQKTPMDKLILHVSMMQELVFPKSKQILKESGYLIKLLNKAVVDEKTAVKFDRLKRHMRDFMY